MGATTRADVSQSAKGTRARSPTASRLIVPGIGVVREGRAEPFLNTRPTQSSAPVQWGGIALENYTVPAVLIARHQHPEHFVHLVLRGTVKYEVNTGGRNLRFTSRPGTIFLLPDLIDRHVSALLLEMTADLGDSSPAGTMYGESLANALAVYLMNRYAVRRLRPAVYKGGLPAYRLKRVLDYIADSLETEISLSQLAAIAGMSPHYFSELFKQSTGRSPHNYVLLQRIERAKDQLRDPKCSIIDAALDAGFQNPSHFARMFRKVVGTAPSNFRSICTEEELLRD